MLLVLISLFLLLSFSIVTILILYFSKRYDPDSLMKNDWYQPKVTIVLPTYNEEENIAKKLDNTLSLDYPREKLQIIVVDSSTDLTPQIVREYAERYPLIALIKEPKRKGVAEALNVGFRAGTGDIVIKSDSDSFVLTKSAIRRVCTILQNQKVGGVCGVRVGGNDVEGGFRSLQTIQQMAETMIDSTIVCHGSFAAFKKSIIEPINPGSWADDTELFIKIRRKGYRTVLDTGIRTYEPYETNLSKRVKQSSRRAGGIIKVLIENIDVLFSRKYGKYGLIVYPLNLLSLVAFPWITLIVGLVLTSLLLSYLGLSTFYIIIIPFLAMISCYRLSKPKLLTGFLDILLFSAIGQIRMLIKRDDEGWYKWKRTKPTAVNPELFDKCSKQKATR